MVKVPLYGGDNTQQLQRAAINPQMNFVKADADNFGAAIGRGLVQLAAGLKSFSSDMEQAQDEMARAEARNAGVEREKALQDIMLGQDGYLTRNGENANGMTRSFESDADRVNTQFRPKNPAAAKYYDQAVGPDTVQKRGQVLGREAKENWQAIQNSYDADQRMRIDTAIRSWDINNPTVSERHIAEGVASIRSQAETNGTPSSVVEEQIRKFNTDARIGIAYSIARDDPLEAMNYIDGNKDNIGLEAYDKAKAVFEPLIIDQKGARNAAKIYTGVGTGAVVEDGGAEAGGQPSAGSTPSPIASELPNGNLQLRGFAATIATRESTNNPGVINKWGFAGLFQFGAPRLIDIGVYTPGQNERISGWGKSKLDTPGKWTGTFNIPGFPHVRTIDDFLGDPKAQVAAYQLHQDLMDKEMARFGLTQFIGQTDRNGVVITKEGIYAMMHLGGAGNAANYLHGRGDAADAFGTRMSDYIKLGQTRSGRNGVLVRNPGAAVSAIVDPREREATAKHLKAIYEAEKAAREAAEAQAQQAIWSQVVRTNSLVGIPPEMLEAAGPTFVKQMEDRAKVTTDMETLYNLKQMANDPEGRKKFANENLLDYADRLSNSDLEQIIDLQMRTRNELNKPIEIDFKGAHSMAEDRLKSVGILAPSASESEETRQKYFERVMQFNDSLDAEMERFVKINGKAPTPAETNDLIGKLLLPMVFSKEGMLWGRSEQPGLLFEADKIRREGYTTANPDVERILATMPADLYGRIVVDLKAQLGREPTPEEVVRNYTLAVTLFNMADTVSPTKGRDR